jgi:hypothetical protein
MSFNPKSSPRIALYEAAFSPQKLQRQGHATNSASAVQFAGFSHSKWHCGDDHWKTFWFWNLIAFDKDQWC